MACKPSKAIKQVTAKENYFIEASSPDELIKALMLRYPGSYDDWKKEVMAALGTGDFVRSTEGGRRRYRTRTYAERRAASAPSQGAFFANSGAVVVS